jgi:hypothetical protein
VLLVDSVVIDDFDVGVVAEDLVVDVALLCVGADHECWDAEPVALAVDGGWFDVVVEAAPVVPAEEDRGRVPGAGAHDRVDQTGDVGLAGGDQVRRMLADLVGGHDPRHRRKRVAGEGGEEVV